MSNNFIDLNNLPFPKVVEELDFETLLLKRKAAFIARFETEEEQQLWRERLQYESEPVVKLLEENAYLELLLRSRVNEAAKSVMLAFATGSDLDQLGALLGVSRLLIREEDLSQNPPILAEYETDERFRLRIQMSLEGLNTAGSRGSYLYHTLSASPFVQDAHIGSTKPGQVDVTVLASLDYGNDENQGEADETLLNLVNAALNAENVRPLTDTVNVQKAERVNYQIQATLTLYPSTLESVVLNMAQQAINAYSEKQFKLGLDITLSGIYAALHQEGVQNVKLLEPTQDLIISPTQVAFCTEINVTVGGRDE